MAVPVLAHEREIAALKAVLAEGPLDIELFSAGFLTAVPAAQLEPGVAGIKKTIGPVVAVTLAVSPSGRGSDGTGRI